MPLHLCAQEDKVEVAKILVKNGAKVDALTRVSSLLENKKLESLLLCFFAQAGYTPLHVAAHFGQINMVRFLLSQGANVDNSTAIGYTPLHQAAQQGHVVIINLLLENKAKPNATTNVGFHLWLFYDHPPSEKVILNSIMFPDGTNGTVDSPKAGLYIRRRNFKNSHGDRYNDNDDHYHRRKVQGGRPRSNARDIHVRLRRRR